MFFQVAPLCFLRTYFAVLLGIGFILDIILPNIPRNATILQDHNPIPSLEIPWMHHTEHGPHPGYVLPYIVLEAAIDIGEGLVETLHRSDVAIDDGFVLELTGRAVARERQQFYWVLHRTRQAFFAQGV